MSNFLSVMHCFGDLSNYYYPAPKQSMFRGASHVRIINCNLSIIGDDQTWVPMATVSAADQETAENDCEALHHTRVHHNQLFDYRTTALAEDRICPPANLPTFDGASNVQISRGHFTSVARGNTSGATDLNEPSMYFIAIV